MGTDDLTGKIALITGAGGGIGALVARELGAGGAVVAAADSDERKLEKLVAELTADGIAATAHPVDVTSADAVRIAVADVERQHGRIDHLVNAAGVLQHGAATELTDQQWAAAFAVNATGVFHVSRAVVPRMRERGSGSVVTVASNAASTPRLDMAAYAASKAAASQFTKCLGLEVAEHGIRCNIVSPGSTDTPMLRSLWRDQDGTRATIDGTPETYRLGIPLRKIAAPQDIARSVAFLLSERAAHITMHELTVDGGATLGV